MTVHPVPPRLPAPRLVPMAQAAPAARTTAAPTAPSQVATRPGLLQRIMLRLEPLPGIHQLGVWIYAWRSRPRADDPPLGNLGEVAPRLLRGAQPTAAGFGQLAARGVDTVINLREERQAERGTVTALGMRYLPLPLSPVGPPTLAQAEAFLAAVTDPANGEVFVHCYHGADRTGALVAAYRIAVDGWTVERAIAELPAYRFNAAKEQDKIRFVQDFATHWAGLGEAQRARLLHR